MTKRITTKTAKPADLTVLSLFDFESTIEQPQSETDDNAVLINICFQLETIGRFLGLKPFVIPNGMIDQLSPHNIVNANLQPQIKASLQKHSLDGTLILFSYSTKFDPTVYFCAAIVDLGESILRILTPQDTTIKDLGVKLQTIVTALEALEPFYTKRAQSFIDEIGEKIESVERVDPSIGWLTRQIVADLNRSANCLDGQQSADRSSAFYYLQ